MNKLIVGAGKASIKLTEKAFPTAEGFVGVHEEIAVRALYIEKEERILIVSIEQSSIMGDSMKCFLEAAMEKSGLPPENIWICATHSFALPHIWDDGADRMKTDAQRAANRLHREAFTEAVAEAVTKSISTKQAAKAGAGESVCNANVSRDIPTSEGWWLGHNEEEVSDKTVSVVRFDSLKEEPIAVLFNYGVQSAVLHKTAGEDGTFLMSGDLAGAACRYVEQEYGNIPAIFLAGACGDQVPAFQTKYFETDKNGKMREASYPREIGFVMIEVLGNSLGGAVVRAAERIISKEPVGSLHIGRETMTCKAQKTDPTLKTLRPSLTYEYLPAGEEEVTIEAVCLDDIAIVGVKSETSSRTAIGLKKKSSYAHTMLCSMVNGSAKYLADDAAFEHNKYEAMNSRFARGSAELFEDKAAELLGEMDVSSSFAPYFNAIKALQ